MANTTDSVVEKQDNYVMITIIIPVYKMERHLEQCLENIKSQSYKKWKIIIVNDGSNKPDEINKIAKNIPKYKCKVIHQENKGLSGARNTGIQAAHTEFVMSLDPDDSLHKDYLSEIMHTFETKISDIIYCWTQVQGSINFVLDTKEIVLFNLLRKNLITSASPFRKTVWSDIGGFDESMKSGYEDWDFWIRACLKKHRFIAINKILFYYNVTSQGMNTAATINREKNIHYIRTKHKEIYDTSLYRIFRSPQFNNISKKSLFWFWLTNIFFLYLPESLRGLIFEMYRKLK